MSSHSNRYGRRRQDMATYHHAYRPVAVFTRDCWYCGEPAETRDHMPALSANSDRPEMQGGRWLIPCCRECNSLAGPRKHLNPVQRREALRNILRRRYARTLTLPEWTTDELQGLSPRMRASIVNAIRDQEAVIRRLADTTLESAMIANDFIIDQNDLMVEEYY